MRRTGELLDVNYKIFALDQQLIISLLRTLTWRSRLARKFVWGRHQLDVEIYVRRNAFLVEHVQMRATDELDHGTFRKCRGTIVQTGCVRIDCGETHMPGCILGPTLAQKTGFLNFFRKS